MAKKMEKVKNMGFSMIYYLKENIQMEIEKEKEKNIIKMAN